MSKNKHQIMPVQETRSRTILGPDNKKIKTPKHHFYLRLTPRTHDFLQMQHNATGLSINSLISLCIDLQLQNLPYYKVDRIEVLYTDDDGIQRKVDYSGNYTRTVSNFKNSEKKEQADIPCLLI